MSPIKPRPVSWRRAITMGPGSFVAQRLGAQLCRRAVFPRAWPAAVVTPRLRLLAVGRPTARATLGRACLALDRARGLHGGPGLEEQADGTADEGLPESGTAGTGVGRRDLRGCWVLLSAFLLGSQNFYKAEPEGPAKVVGTSFAFQWDQKMDWISLRNPRSPSEWIATPDSWHHTLSVLTSLRCLPRVPRNGLVNSVGTWEFWGGAGG